nr:PQQ-binding-like beta-propeller repeat protein [Anaerolineae bacterium]
MSNAKQVFISHATKDAQLAHRLADDLQRLGVRVWIAPESIRPGESWVSAIERGLGESSHVVVVLTPAALESKWVKKETDVAIAQERKGRIQVIPLDVEPCEVPLLLSSYQMVSFRRDYDAGLSQLATILGVRVTPPEPEVPIFCPQCDKFVGEKPRCSQCGWEREAEEAAPAGQEVWRFAAGDKLYSAPTIHQDTLYVGTEDGVLHAVDTRQGKEVWRCPLPEHWLPTEAAAAEGLVFIGTRDARPLGSGDKALLALDAATGEEAWRFETGALNLSAPVVGAGRVYFAVNDGTVYALEAKGGQELWRRRIEGWTPFAPTMAEGTLYLGSQGPTLHALDAESGRVKWRFTTGGQVLYSPAAAEGVVYFGSWDGNLYAVDAQRGDEIWRFTAGGALTTSPTVAEGIVYFGCYDRQVYAVKA